MGNTESGALDCGPYACSQDATRAAIAGYAAKGNTETGALACGLCAYSQGVTQAAITDYAAMDSAEAGTHTLRPLHLQPQRYAGCLC